MRRRLGLLALPVLAAVGLLVAGCGNYTEKSARPLPQKVETTKGATTAAESTATETTGEATTTAAESTAAESTAEAATTEAATTEAAAGEGAAAAGDPAAGKTVFTSSGCVACHTLADAGASGAVGPNLDEVKPDAALVKEFVTNGKGAMPAFKGQLSDKQIDDVAAYISSVAGK